MQPKLNDDRVRDIWRRHHDQRVPCHQLAKEHSVTAGAIYAIVHRQTWKHVITDEFLLAARRDRFVAKLEKAAAALQQMANLVRDDLWLYGVIEDAIRKAERRTS